MTPCRLASLRAGLDRRLHLRLGHEGQVRGALGLVRGLRFLLREAPRPFEDGIRDAQRRLARLEGVWTSPEGAALVAALTQDDEDRLVRRSAAVAVTMGRGKLVLLGFRPQHRAQTDGTSNRSETSGRSARPATSGCAFK